MGYFVKNSRIVSFGGAVQIPVGDTASRPIYPLNGQMRYNTDTSRFEIYYNAWKEVAINGNVGITKDSFTGDGSTVDFYLSKAPPSEPSTQVFVGNVHQNPGTAFTVSGSIISFASAPPNGQTVLVFQGFNSTDAN